MVVKSYGIKQPAVILRRDGILALGRQILLGRRRQTIEPVRNGGKPLVVVLE